jgi:ABC-2 type transport system ATP-binding protein
MLKFINVTKTFNSDLFAKEFVAVKDLSFEIKEGKVIGFLGANGAGKTTSMKMLMDFIRPSSGSIEFDKSMGTSKSEILNNIGFLPERPYFYPHLTGKDFCFYMGKLSGLNESQIVNQIEKWAPVFKIAFALDRKLKNYSKGMLQRIGFLVTLLHDPKLIILDEPLSGLDPVGRKELKDVIREVQKDGKTVFFSSHIISDVEEVCSEVIFIKDGSLFYEGTVEEIVSKNTSGKFKVVYQEKDKRHINLIEGSKKEVFLKELLSQGAEIISINQDKLSLEEIIYDVKS